MPGLLPLRWVTTHEFCPRQLFLEQTLNLKPERGPQDLKRAILQEALRYANRAEPGVVKGIKDHLPKQKLQDRYYAGGRRALQEAILANKDELSEHHLSIIDTSRDLWQELKPYIHTRVENTHTFMTTNRVYGNDLWWDLIPKITHVLQAEAPDLGLALTVDRLDNYPHAATPWTFKKSHAPENGVWPSDQTEMGLIMLALGEQGLIIHEGVVGYDNGRTPRHQELTNETRHKAEQAVANTRAILDHETLPPRVENTRKCEHCPLKPKCYDDTYMAAKMQEHTKTITFKTTQRNL